MERATVTRGQIVGKMLESDAWTEDAARVLLDRPRVRFSSCDVAQRVASEAERTGCLEWCDLNTAPNEWHTGRLMVIGYDE